MKGYVARKGQPLGRGDLRRHRPGDRSGTTQPAPGRRRPDRRRAARRPPCQRPCGRQRRGQITQLRRLPHQPVAAGQAGRARRHELQRLSPQRREPHRPRPRPHWAAAAASPPSRGALRQASIPATAAPHSLPRPCTRSTSSSVAHLQTPPDAVSSPGMSRSSRTLHGSGRSPRSSRSPGPLSNYQRSCAPPQVTGYSPRSGCPPSPGCVATICSGPLGRLQREGGNPLDQPRARRHPVRSCTRRVARLQQRGAGSTSTPRP